jgi:subtilisin family serine protease
MKRWIRVLTVVAACAPLVAGASLPADAATTYLLQTTGGIPADAEQVVVAAGGTVLRLHPEIGLVVALSDDPDFQSRLAATHRFAGAARDIPAGAQRAALAGSGPRYRAIDTTPELLAAPPSSFNDPTSSLFFACQWHIPRLGIPEAWAQGAFGDGVKVAMLSTGIDATHPDMVGRVDEAQSAVFLTPGSSPCNPAVPDEETVFDFHLVGTLFAGQITSNNIGMAGVAPLAQVVAVKVNNCLNAGTVADAIAGTLYAASLEDVDVIAMLMTFYLPDEGANRPLLRAFRHAVDYARRQGKLVVSQAGQDGVSVNPPTGADLTRDGNMVAAPAEFSSSLTAYAVSNQPHEPLPNYTNFGFPAARIGAPGGNIPPNTEPPLPGCPFPQSSQSAFPGPCSKYQVTLPFTCGPGSYVLGINTAISASLVAATAVLVQGEAGGHLSPGAMEAILERTADDLGEPGTDHFHGHGRVNTGRAVASVPGGLGQ